MAENRSLRFNVKKRLRLLNDSFEFKIESKQSITKKLKSAKLQSQNNREAYDSIILIR